MFDCIYPEEHRTYQTERILCRYLLKNNAGNTVAQITKPKMDTVTTIKVLPFESTCAVTRHLVDMIAIGQSLGLCT
jgi:hypothetical protein